MLDRDIVEEPLSNDLLAMSTVMILAEYRGNDYGSRAVRKIVETIGYHCGAVVMKAENGSDTVPEIVAEEEPADGNPIELPPTKDPSILLVVPY